MQYTTNYFIKIFYIVFYGNYVIIKIAIYKC